MSRRPRAGGSQDRFERRPSSLRARRALLLASWAAAACHSGADPSSEDPAVDAAVEVSDARLEPVRDASVRSDAALDAAEDSIDTGPTVEHDPLRADEVRAARVLATTEWTDLPTLHASGLELQLGRREMVQVEEGATRPVRLGACRGRDAEGYTVCLVRVADRVRVSRARGEDSQLLIEVDAAEFPGLANDWVVTSDTTVFFSNRCDGHERCVSAPSSAIGSVLRLREGRLEEAHRGLLHPNGLALSPDERTLYVATSAYTDASLRRLHALPVDARGELGDPRAIADVPTPDGMAVDRHGNVWVASDRSSVRVLSPSGVLFGRVRAEGRVTNVAVADGVAFLTTDTRGVWRFEEETTR